MRLECFGDAAPSMLIKEFGDCRGRQTTGSRDIFSQLAFGPFILRAYPGLELLIVRVMRIGRRNGGCNCVWEDSQRNEQVPTLPTSKRRTPGEGSSAAKAGQANDIAMAAACRNINREKMFAEAEF